ncbi:hypothetical protein Tco_0317083 [Tanacetum coccineum]
MILRFDQAGGKDLKKHVHSMKSSEMFLGEGGHKIKGFFDSDAVGILTGNKTNQIRYHRTLNEMIMKSICRLEALKLGNGQERKEELHNKSDDQHVHRFQAEWDNLHCSTERRKELMEGHATINQTPRKIKRGQDTKTPQSSGPPKKFGDEAVHKDLGDRMERAATTASSLEAEQDSGNINRTQSMATLNDTLKNGDMEITATIDGKFKVVFEASIRRHLKLEDSDGISTLPNTEIFEQLALMGPKKTSWEQFSSNIATAIICLTTNRTFNFSKMIFEGMGQGSTIQVDSHPTTTSAPSTSQPPTSPPSMHTTHVVEEATPMPYDSPLPRVHSLGSDEGSMTLNELTPLCT